MSDFKMSDVYKKVECNDFERPDYVLKNGRAINVYGMLNDVHELQKDLAESQAEVERLRDSLCELVGEFDADEVLHTEYQFKIMAKAKKLLSKDGE